MLNIDYIIETRIKSYIKIYLLYHPLFIKLCIKFKLYYSYTALIRSVPIPGDTAVICAASAHSGEIKCFGTLY